VNRVIAMAIHNRPWYLKQVIDGLNLNPEFADYTLVASIEPGTPETFEILDTAACAKKHLILNADVRGAENNIRQALTVGFLQTDYLIFVEDDCVPAPDALAYYEHCRAAYADDKEIFTVAGYRRAPEDPGRDQDHAILRREYFTCWGWATWKDRWQEAVEKWDEPRIHQHAWDSWFAYYLRAGRQEVYPVLSRIQNVGAVGTNVPDPGWYVENHYSPFWAGNVEVESGEWEEVTQ
jgi:hypothetical protein